MAVRSDGGAGPRNCSRAGSIQSREKLAPPRRYRDEDGTRSGCVGGCWSGNTFTSMGSWIMRIDGADSMINMFDCAWPVWGDTKEREGAKWRWEWDFGKEIGRWRFRWFVQFAERARILSSRSDTRLDWWWKMCRSIESCTRIISIQEYKK